MKKIFIGIVWLGLLGSAPVVYAQTAANPAPIEYSEQVPAEGADQHLLYQWAVEWSENHFKYTPKLDVQADQKAGTLRLWGSGKVKTATVAEKTSDVPVQFEFLFHLTGSGYEYSVGNFRVILNARQPGTTLPLDDYAAKLVTERNNERTKNDRRVRAQANSLANEVALSFRSFMNNKEAQGSNHIGMK